MTTAPDPGVGKRVEALRRRAGLSRERLAALTEVSPTLIKFVETGRRALTLRAAQRIAPYLNVRDLSELYGPSITYTLGEHPTHAAMPDVRRALTRWPLRIEGTPPAAEYLRGSVDAAWRTWHTSRHQRSEVGGILPDLIGSAQHAARGHTGDDRRRSQVLLAEVYHLAQAWLAWHGDRELVWLTVDRAMNAALDADDPLAIAGASWYAAHLLRAVGRSDEAIERLGEARELIEPRIDGGPVEYPAMLADLHLCTALTRARTGDEGAWHDWEAANRVVRDLLPEGYVGPWTRVGAALVEVTGVMCAVELGAADTARQRAHNLDPASIPSTDRRAGHYIELARNADLEGSPEATLHLLELAQAVSPETVTYSPAARELAGRLVASSGAAIRERAERLSQSLGLAP